jgi:hypothetical protein
LGKFESVEACKEIALLIIPIVDSPHLKFNHMEGSLIFHFASEVDYVELSDYFTVIFDEITEIFILTEVTDRMTVSLPKSIKDHLFDLEKDSPEVEIRVNLNRGFQEIDEQEEDDSSVALLLEEIKSKIKKPSLDYILDKINIKGFNSLTPFEKDTLEEYSK